MTVVEFFDYNCGYCRKALSGLLKAMDEDKNLKVIFKEYPIFGENRLFLLPRRHSLLASREDIWIFHKALFKVNERVTERAVIRTA